MADGPGALRSNTVAAYCAYAAGIGACILTASSAPIAERAGLAGPGSTRLIDGLWAATMLIAVAGAVLTAVAWSGLNPSDAFSNMGAAAAAAGYATLGALIVRRAGNPIGWLLLSEGAALAIICLVSAYAVAGITTHPGTLPAAQRVGAVAEWVFFPALAVVALTLLLFPSGTLPSRRWRPVVTLTLLLTGLLLAGFIVVPRRVALPAPGGISLTYQNPFSIQAAGHALSALPIGNLNGLTLLSVLVLGAAAVSLVLRYRAGDGELRRQVNWVALTGVAFALLQLVAIVAIVADHGQLPVVAAAAYEGTAVIALFGLPAAITVGTCCSSPCGSGPGA